MTKKSTPVITTEFINLQSDYGFKRAFGTPEFQNNVIMLLDAALGSDINVTRIISRNDGTDGQEFEGIYG